jgi:alpha-L-fucosidase 2
VDIAWQDGKLTTATIRSVDGTATRVRYGSAAREVNLKKGQSFTWDGK